MSNELMIISQNGSQEKTDLAHIASATRQSMETVFSKLDLASISGTSDSRLSDEQAKETATLVIIELKRITKGIDDDMSGHFGFLLLRAAAVNTSNSAIYRNNYSYTIGAKTYTVEDSDIFNFIRLKTQKYGKPNGLRAFFAAMETPYLILAKTKPELLDSRLSTRRGTPKAFGYLSADFLSGASPVLSDQERAVLNSASSYALDRSASKKKTGGLVSLYDYGRYD
ncbi:ORF6 [Carrot closterovirus 1]|uniref:ORF6 n=1 Tax=Carrot closterovirus 1 TaxID=2843916 RepID=A0A0A0P6W0_9CLOS|nr:ORF6 [Carrot closterovirus]AHA85414.1 ORF6 [Carrot closterovirus 1]